MEGLGDKLKKIRLEKGLSLEEVQKRTRIHLNILKAIEGESLTNLSPVYLKGFIKIYCHALGLNPDDYISSIKEPQRKAADKIAAKDTLSKSAVGSKSALLGGFRPSKILKRIFIVTFIIAALAITFINLGKFISSKRQLSLTQKKTTQPKKAAKGSVKPKKTKPNQPKPLAAGLSPVKQNPPPTLQSKAVSSQKENASLIRLGIRARDNCWVFLKADGRVVFQRVLEKGRFESWQAKDKFELSLGNAGAVELEVNGQVFSNLGKKGETRKNILITQEGLSTAR